MTYYLFRYASEKLHTALYVLENCQCTMRQLFACNASDAVSDGNAILQIIDSLKNLPLEKNSRPLLVGLGGKLFYLQIPYGDHICVAGPVRIDEPFFCLNTLSAKDFEQYSNSLGDLAGDFQNWSEGIVTTLLAEVLDIMLLLYNTGADETRNSGYLNRSRLIEENIGSDSSVIDNMNELYKTEFSFIENGVVHNPFQHEEKECASIQNGDVDALLNLQKIDYSRRFGKLSSSPIRDKINHGIVAVTTASRAAIRGGLHPETAFHLSDIAIRKLDECKDSVTPVRIYKETQRQYAELVRLHNAHSMKDTIENIYISHCKDYIFTHLHGSITVAEVADAIGLNANYLSSLFRKCEHIPMKRFINNEKIQLAKNLLAYSDYSYLEIASYLGFSSQSHLGAEFKRVTGMTPHEYRKVNAHDDFIAETIE